MDLDVISYLKTDVTFIILYNIEGKETIKLYTMTIETNRISKIIQNKIVIGLNLVNSLNYINNKNQKDKVNIYFHQKNSQMKKRELAKLMK